MRARFTFTRDNGGYAYEVLDERGVLRASGWSRGSKRDTMIEARADARRLGLEVP
jgi:hypothetical protein